MELTQEHFNEVVKGLATKQDLKPLARAEQIEELARMVSSGFEDIQERLDVTSRMTKLEKQMTEIRTALHLNT